jgi:hydroxyacylglutathione hydrolase
LLKECFYTVHWKLDVGYYLLFSHTLYRYSTNDKINKMILEKLVVGPFNANCYIVGCPDTLEGAVIDPGADGEKILKTIKKRNLKIKYIINTHAHIDHIEANRYLKDTLGAEICMHEADVKMLSDSSLNLSHMLYPSKESPFPIPDILLKEGDEIKTGHLKFSVIHTPGHTPGSICLAINKYLFTGDTLFSGSIGAIDLPLANHEILISSINKIFKLSDDFHIYPGHGSPSEIGIEKRENPYL